MMEECAKNNPDDTNKIDLNKINDIGVDEEGGEIKDIKNKYMINRYITENEP